LSILNRQEILSAPPGLEPPCDHRAPPEATIVANSGNKSTLARVLLSASSTELAMETQMAMQGKLVRDSIGKTMNASLAAIAIGLALVSSGGPSFAYNNVSTNVSSQGSNNTYNPLAPSNSGVIGTVDTGIGAGQAANAAPTNCHLLTGYSKAATCQ
jgi:hypothetical protein